MNAIDRMTPPLEETEVLGNSDAALDDLARQVRALMASYFERVERDERFIPIYLGKEVPPTEVLAFVSGLLRGANIELFELGMWQSWSGLKR